MPSKTFQEYQEALTAYSARVVEVSQQINTNRAQFQVAHQKYEAAVLDDNDAAAHEQEQAMAGLNAELEILTRKANALNSVSKKGANSTIKKAAQQVFQVNQAEIQKMQKEYDERKQALLAMQKKYLEALCEIGHLARLSSVLREECVLCSQDSQLSISVPSLADELGGQISRRRGWIFPDQDAVAHAFTSAEMPVDQTFTGIPDPAPASKLIRTDSGDPAVPRQYRAKPRPAKAEELAE